MGLEEAFGITVEEENAENSRSFSLQFVHAIASAFCTSLRSAISDADSGVYSPSLPQFAAAKLHSSAAFHTFSNAVVAVSSRRRYNVSCTLDGVDSLSPVLKDEQGSVSIPLPIVQIIQDPECDATTVEISFGDRLGLLIDTMKALKDLGLDVVKGVVTTQDSVKKTKFLITRLDTGRKVEDPDLLENIRLTIIQNLIKYHPESSERLAMGEAFGIKAPEKKPDVDIATHIHVKDDGPKRSMLYVETADRSGLLMEVIKIMADINIHVESAEIDTEGLIAKDKFYVSYGGAALTRSMSQVLVNCLRYYLRRPETDDESY